MSLNLAGRACGKLKTGRNTGIFEEAAGSRSAAWEGGVTTLRTGSLLQKPTMKLHVSRATPCDGDQKRYGGKSQEEFRRQ